MCIDSRNAGEERAFPPEKVFCGNRKGQGLYKSEEQECCNSVSKEKEAVRDSN
uniref:Uncharacterized protein n=1 Tax=Arundo donax TaxID=35708 RepID=A0A0A9D6S8_ARUDO